MSTEEKIEKQLLISMNAIDEMTYLSFERDEGPDDELWHSFMRDLVAMKQQQKFWLNNKFDSLARRKAVSDL